MTTRMQIEQLKKEANSNPVAKDVLAMFATRKRTRQNVQVDALEKRMIGEGFRHTKDEYRAVLRFLANTGFGKLDLGPGGKIRGLKELRVTLQSIGLAAYGEGKDVAGFKKRARFGDLQAGITGIPAQIDSPQAAHAVAKSVSAEMRQGPSDRRRAPRPYQVANAKVMLTFILDSGKPVSIPLPPDMSTEDTANLIDRLQSGEARSGKEIGRA